jgi:hypothetical protein
MNELIQGLAGIVLAAQVQAFPSMPIDGTYLHRPQPQVPVPPIPEEQKYFLRSTTISYRRGRDYERNEEPISDPPRIVPEPAYNPVAPLSFKRRAMQRKRNQSNGLSKYIPS